MGIGIDWGASYSNAVAARGPAVHDQAHAVVDVGEIDVMAAGPFDRGFPAAQLGLAAGDDRGSGRQVDGAAVGDSRFDELEANGTARSGASNLDIGLQASRSPTQWGCIHAPSIWLSSGRRRGSGAFRMRCAIMLVL